MNCSQKYRAYIIDRQEKLKILNYQKLKPLYDEYCENGFKGVVEKFNYKRSRINLYYAFKRYIPEFSNK